MPPAIENSVITSLPFEYGVLWSFNDALHTRKVDGLNIIWFHFLHFAHITENIPSNTIKLRKQVALKKAWKLTSIDESNTRSVKLLSSSHCSCQWIQLMVSGSTDVSQRQKKKLIYTHGRKPLMTLCYITLPLPKTMIGLSWHTSGCYTVEQMSAWKSRKWGATYGGVLGREGEIENKLGEHNEGLYTGSNTGIRGIWERRRRGHDLYIEIIGDLASSCIGQRPVTQDAIIGGREGIFWLNF